MSTITLPNIRVSSDLTVSVRLKDNGVAIDWSTLNNVKASIYSDAQRALAGRCDVSVDAEDPTVLVCQYAANKPQYVGVCRIVVSAKYMGETKTYDKPAFNFVRWTADQDGEQITIDDPDVDVEIEVSDVSSSLLDEAIRAAFTAAEEAVDAKGQVLETEAEVEAAEALRVSAEESRVEAEEGRAEAEAARVDEEAVRVSAEDARVVAENARAAAEDLREGAEDDRAAAETARETAEAARVAAEALRVTAEGSRETAEAAREAQASADHTVAAGDHTQAAADHTQAAADHTTAASDHTQAGADHTLAAADHVTAGEDHAQAQDDHEVMEGYDTRLGSVESEVSQLEAKVDDLSTGKYYGYFAQEEDLPEADVDGFAYVGEGPTYTIYNLRGGVWTSSDITVNQSPIGNDEDIDQNEDGKLQFANRVYNAQQPNGMGYKILRKDATFASQVTDTNTIYEIRYDFSLEGNPFALPNGCVLRFNGGSISNGSLSNVGKTEGATEGSITALISSFSNSIRTIRTSDYSVGINSAPEYNNSVFQAAIEKQIAIEIDNTRLGAVDGSDAITFASPLRITKSRVTIKGVGYEGGQLYFPNGDAIVYTERAYYTYNCFENLAIVSKGWCFNFVNCQTEGVENPNRPYNIFKSVFRDLFVKSLEKDCFYQGGVAGYGGESALLFQVLFSNITLWTPRYGFNGILGATDFVVERLTDSNVPESFFFNTHPSVVRYVNSSFSGTKNFMRFDDSIVNYSIGISCEYCSFEGFTGEIFLDENFASTTRVYNLSLNKCAFAYYASTFPSGKVELYPIKLNRLPWIRWKDCAEPSIGYADGFGIIRTQTNDNVDTDKELTIFYGNNSQGGYVGTFQVKPAISIKRAIAGGYPNYVAPIESGFFKGDAMMASLFGFTPQVIDVTSNRTPTINSTMVELNSEADTQINYIIPAPLGLFGGAGSAPFNTFGKFIMFYNASSFNITFISGYLNAVVAEDTPFFVMRPQEFAIAVYDMAKTGDRFVVVKRLNAFLKAGETSQRPTLTVYEQGFSYYDKGLKKMILWNGTAWVNMDGSALA